MADRQAGRGDAHGRVDGHGVGAAGRGPDVSVAVTVKVKVPAAVGVPESTPAAAQGQPVGRVPVVARTSEPRCRRWR